MPTDVPPRRSSAPLIESLEHRRLLAATIAASDNLLVFNDVVGGGYSRTEGVIITNTGTTPLNIADGGIRIDGSHPQNFVVTFHPELPAAIAPGGSIQVRAAFRASGLGIRHAQLQIHSDDPNSPMLAIGLRGLGTQGLFSSAEPSLQRILQVHDIPTHVGDSNPDSPVIDPPDDAGEQINAPFLRKAGPGPVSIEMIGLFSSASDPAGRFGYYTTGGGSLNELFVVHGDDVQSVSPRTIGSTSFDPGNATFGLFSTWPNFPGRVVFSHDERNTWAGDPSDQQKYRFYPMRNRDGTIQLDALVVGVEEAANNDFQDAAFIIRNVKPNIGPAAPDGIIATPVSSSAIQLSWNDNADNEYGYVIERSRSKSGTYMEIATTPVNTTTFLDTELRRDTRYYYRVRALSPTDSSQHTGRTSARTFVLEIEPILLSRLANRPLFAEAHQDDAVEEVPLAVRLTE